MNKVAILIFSLATSTALFAATNATNKSATVQDAVKNLIDQGVQFHEQGQYDEAIAKYKAAEKKDPKNALIKYEMAFTYHAKHEIDKALTYAKAATKLKTITFLKKLFISVSPCFSNDSFNATQKKNIDKL